MEFSQIFKEQDGQVSSRRCGAIFCLLFAAFLSILIIHTRIIDSWYIFVPVGLFLAVSILLWFFTSWSEIKELTSIFKK
jgi:hypothetical protein